LTSQLIIDNRGLSCPMPVVNTKKALEKWAADLAAGKHIVSILDNETASANVLRFVEKAGYQAVLDEKSDGIYIAIAARPLEETERTAPVPEKPVPACTCENPSSDETGLIYLVTSSLLGRGDEELGRVLMTSFFNTFLDNEELPSKLLFMNSGVYLTVEDSPVLESLNRMEEKGVEILSCGTCLDYYGLKEKLKVGEVTNMYDTVEAISSAAYRCVTI